MTMAIPGGLRGSVTNQQLQSQIAQKRAPYESMAYSGYCPQIFAWPTPKHRGARLSDRDRLRIANPYRNPTISTPQCVANPLNISETHRECVAAATKGGA